MNVAAHAAACHVALLANPKFERADADNMARMAWDHAEAFSMETQERLRRVRRAMKGIPKKLWQINADAAKSALRHCKGSPTRAARRLGIERGQMRGMIELYGLHSETRPELYESPEPSGVQ